MENSLADWILDVLNDVDGLLVKNGLLGASDKMIDVKFEVLLALSRPTYPKDNIVDFNAYRTRKLETNSEPTEVVSSKSE